MPSHALSNLIGAAIRPPRSFGRFSRQHPAYLSHLSLSTLASYHLASATGHGIESGEAVTSVERFGVLGHRNVWQTDAPPPRKRLVLTAEPVVRLSKLAAEVWHDLLRRTTQHSTGQTTSQPRGAVRQRQSLQSTITTTRVPPFPYQDERTTLLFLQVNCAPSFGNISEAQANSTCV